MRPGDAGRERILGRIREALDGREAAGHPGPPPGLSGPGDDDPVGGFSGAFRRAGGEVVVLEGERAARRWLEAFAGEHRSAVVGEEVPPPLRPALPGVPAGEAELGVSLALAAAADTGTLLLGSGGGRSGQVLPPVHLVWVRASDVRGTLSGAMEAVRHEGLPAVLALHSGPSKSADIGRIVVTGVHGPGRVVAAVLEGC